MAIAFSEIPQNRRKPGVHVEIDNSQAVRGLPGMPHRTLIIGQRLATGEVAAGERVLITDPEQAAVAWGRGSMIHAMCEIYRRNNGSTEMWGIGLDDAVGATAAVKQVDILRAGPGNFGAGTLSLYVGGRLLRIGVSSDDEPEDVAARVVAAAADDPMLPMTAVVAAAQTRRADFTAKHAGAVQDGLDIRVNYFAGETLPSNMIVNIIDDTAGATDPVLDATLDAIAGEWFTEIVTPYLDGAAVNVLDEHLAAQFGALVQQDGMAFGSQNGTVTELFNAGQTRNSPHITVLPHQNAPTPTYEVAAWYAAIAAFQTQIDPARQLKTLGGPGVLAPAVEDRFTNDELDLMLNNGISSAVVIGGEFVLDRCVTTYTTSPAGADDPSFLDLTTMTTLAFLRYSEEQRILLRFPRHKLANDGTNFGPGQPIITPEIMRGELIGLYSEWERVGLVEDAAGFAERLIVERDQGDPNRLNTLQAPDLINNFRVSANLLQFIL